MSSNLSLKLRRLALFAGLTILAFGLLGLTARSRPAQEQTAQAPPPAVCQAPVKAAVGGACPHSRYGVMLVTQDGGCAASAQMALLVCGAL